MRAMQGESISYQYRFNVQASEKNGDDSDTAYCLIDCYIGNCYFPRYSAVLVRWKSKRQHPAISRSTVSKSI